MESDPTVSVIIPTHNRCASLQRALGALCAQTYSLREVEVIVVADGCADDTADVVGRYTAPFMLRLIDQPGQGPAAARNCGAAQARGRLLLFMDDDIEPASCWIEAHVSAHAGRTDRVVIGYLPPFIQEPADFFHIELRGWWEAMFQPMRRSDHRFGYWDLLSGNFSLPAALFFRVGGFDSTLWCHEDYELGFRLIQAGAPFTFAEDAWGYHHEVTDLDRSLERKYQEGRADVMIGRRHAEPRPALPLARFGEPWSSLSRRLRRLAFTSPAVGGWVAASLRRTLDLMEEVRLRGRWRRLLDELLDYWYWRGVAEALGTREALTDFTRPGEDVPAMELDLCEGLEACEGRLDAERPASLRVWYGRHPIGYVPPKPGAEPLRGVHLRRILATELLWPLSETLLLSALTDEIVTPQQLWAGRAIQSEEVVL